MVGNRKGTRRKVILRRRAPGFELAVYYARRFGRIILVFVLAVWLAAWFIAAGGIEKTRDWSYHKTLELSADLGFRVRNILVEGRRNTSPEVIMALVNMEKGDPLFAFDPAGAREMIERISWVQTARVERRLPDTIYVGLEERAPLALWRRSNGSLALIDHDARVLSENDLRPFMDMITVSGPGAPENAGEFFSLLDAEPELKVRIKSAKRIGKRRWDLRLKNGIEVNLPGQDTGMSLRRLMLAHEEGSILDKDIVGIDLRKDDRIIVRPRRGAASDWKTGADTGI